MEIFDVNSSVLIVIAVLVSLGRLARIFFATLRIWVREYSAFRDWLRSRRHSEVVESRD